MAKQIMDEAHEETEVILKRIEKQITKEYAQAEEEIREKLNDYLRRFSVKDEIWQRWVEEGKKTPAEYQQWRIGQIMIGKRWQEMRDTIAEDLTHAAEIAKSAAFEHMPEVYAINHNYGTFQVEKTSKVNTSYTLYNRQTVERLMQADKIEIFHKPGKRVTAAINEGKQKAWDKKQVASVMMQSIIQGEAIHDIATRLSKAVGDGDRKASIRNARTMATGVQNAGRLDSYKRAEKMGIKLQKQWIATLDGRTRHWHRQLDMVKVGTDEPFENDFGKIMFPGDPSANPGNIYNCRCTMITQLQGFERDMSSRYDADIQGMSYDEWREGHGVSQPIMHQENVSNAMKQAYVNEYSGAIRNNPNFSVDQPKRNKSQEYTKMVEKVRKDAENNGIEYIKPNKVENELTEDEIVMKIGKKDYTNGSCVSVAIAYVGNKAGYDVKDFRGGASCDFFNDASVIKNIALLPDVGGELMLDTNDIKAVKKLLKKTNRNGEYILSTGGHVAIIRKRLIGYDYLELQDDNKSNGWKPLTEDILIERFGCNTTSKKYAGIEIPSTSAIIDVDKLKSNEEFIKLLGYINSDE